MLFDLELQRRLGGVLVAPAVRTAAQGTREGGHLD